jgi:epoxyqueuosine reductase
VPDAEPDGRPDTGSSLALSRELVSLGTAAGLAAVGVAGAEVFADTRSDLVERRSRGLSAEMQFTYRNPERSTDPDRIVRGARALVVGAWSYRHEGGESGRHERRSGHTGPSDSEGSPRPMGRVARYARHDHYADLRRALEPMAVRLRDGGWRAMVVCDDNALVDRAAAHRAGLGWFGKNSLILLPGLGSWFVLGTVVTDAPLAALGPSEPAAHGDGCGSCSACIGACPTGALVAPGVLDARRCLAWLVQAPGSIPEEYRVAMGGRIYGCDECQQVCPINRLADRRHPTGTAPATAAGAANPDGDVDLLDLLGSSDEELLASHGRWYIADRDPRYLRRNALVALGNVGSGSDPATVTTLRRWIGDDDPMVAEHARWAARRLGRADLAGSVRR